MKCPCKECISLAICRHKDYLELFIECYIIRQYIPHHDNYVSRNSYRVKRLFKVLNPTLWKYVSTVHITRKDDKHEVPM